MARRDPESSSTCPTGYAGQIDGDGLLVAEDRAVRQLRLAKTVRTASEGRAQFPSRRLQGRQCHVAERYLRVDQAKLIQAMGGCRSKCRTWQRRVRRLVASRMVWGVMG